MLPLEKIVWHYQHIVLYKFKGLTSRGRRHIFRDTRLDMKLLQHDGVSTRGAKKQLISCIIRSCGQSDGVMPQLNEAISIAKSARFPISV